jgi:hypothetical protein
MIILIGISTIEENLIDFFFFFFSSRDYRGEHICADTLFSCHQRDEQYYYNPEHRPYGIATM